jgi:hypothetical protein
MLHQSVPGALALMVLASGTALAYTADELAARNVAAKGGEEKLAAIHSFKAGGRLLVSGGTIELKYTLLVTDAGLIRSEAQLQGLTQVAAWDGHTGWQINPFQGRKEPEQLPADDARELAENAADFAGPLVGWKGKGYRLDYLGTQDVDGTEAYKLRVTRRNGDITTVYLDPDYFLEIRTVDRRIVHGVPQETVTDYGDYEKVGGVYFAFATESGVAGSSDREKLQIDRAEINIDAPDVSFHMPGAAP